MLQTSRTKKKNSTCTEVYKYLILKTSSTLKKEEKYPHKRSDVKDKLWWS